jgi:hypothetical protein
MGFSNFLKNVIEILVGVTLHKKILLCRIIILIILEVSIHECEYILKYNDVNMIVAYYQTSQIV